MDVSMGVSSSEDTEVLEETAVEENAPLAEKAPLVEEYRWWFLLWRHLLPLGTKHGGAAEGGGGALSQSMAHEGKALVWVQLLGWWCIGLTRVGSPPPPRRKGLASGKEIRNLVYNLLKIIFVSEFTYVNL